MAGPERKTERFDRGVEPAALERNAQSVDDRLSRERFVSAPGRAGFARGIDAGVRPKHRQVIRTTGGAHGKKAVAVQAVGQDGRMYLRERTPSSTFASTALSAQELQIVRQLMDHLRVVANPEQDD